MSKRFKLTFIRNAMREIFMRFMRASSSRIYLAVNQSSNFSVIFIFQIIICIVIAELVATNLFFSSKSQNKVCMNKSWFTANPNSHCMSVISGVMIIFRNSGSVFLIYLLIIIHGSQTFGHFQ